MVEGLLGVALWFLWLILGELGAIRRLIEKQSVSDAEDDDG